MSIVNEEWRDVVGFEGYYQVSNLGRVRSLDRTVVAKAGHSIFLKGRIMKLRLSHGYWAVGLCVNGVMSSAKIHCLVAKAFIGDRPLGYDINHIDGNKLNNAVSNLEYCTHAKNMQHAVSTGLQLGCKGEDHPKSILTDRKVLEIRRLFAQGGISKAAIARMYGVSYGAIFDILSNRRWTHVKDPYENTSAPSA